MSEIDRQNAETLAASDLLAAAIVAAEADERGMAARVGHVVYPRQEALERDLSDSDAERALGDTPTPDRPVESDLAP